MRGIVKDYDEERGFGWIEPADESGRCFAHVTELKGTVELALVIGEEVEFTPTVGPKGPVAKEISRVEVRHQGIVQTFEKGYGFILPKNGGGTVFVHKSDIATSARVRRLEPREEVSYVAVSGERGIQAVRVRRLDPRRPLEKFAFLPDFDEQLAALASLAQDEPGNWNYQLSKSPQPFPVLWSYIHYTFARLEEEGKIAETPGEKGVPFACFNTGLATKRQEAIFAVFSKNTDRNAARLPSPWVLNQFAKESDRALTFFAKKPDIANYFTEPSELLFDTRLQVSPDYDHIVGDNKARFPPEFNGNEDAMLVALRGAIAAAERRVKRNYKAAIPQFYRGGLQLLLPLCLVKPERADLALVVARENQVYRASTVLTLDQAYNNARLVARPDTEWLNP